MNLGPARLLRGFRRAGGMAAMRLGRIASAKPLSDIYGYDRGTPIDRFYIDAFIQRHAGDIRGRVLEIGGDYYSRRFGGEAVEKLDVLHLSPEEGGTIAGDISKPGTLPAGTFDCVMATQSLQYIFDLAGAVANVRAALRPGGVALITVPGLAPMSVDPWDHYWIFTSDGMKRLLSEAFEREKAEVGGFGNLYAATAFLHCAAVQEVDKRKLVPHDRRYDIVIGARAVA